MTSLESGFVILCVIFSGALLGMLVAWRLPRHHVSQETQTMVTVSMAVVGTMSALVLGLLISSANNSFSTRNAELGRMSADIIRLDQLLHRYGPEADTARTSLQKYTQMKFDDLFPEGRDKKPKLANPATIEILEHVQDMILALRPTGDRQTWLHAQALQLAGEISETRWLLVLQNASSIPKPFLILLVFWLTLLFASFGLFAPNNVTALTALFLCALAVSGGIEMVLEMDHPFDGAVRISSASLRNAVDTISQ